MSEGELNNRFEQKVKFGFILDFYKDLDEAKKEFPLIEPTEFTDYKELAKKQDLKLAAVNNWFKKWFIGDK